MNNGAEGSAQLKNCVQAVGFSWQFAPKTREFPGMCRPQQQKYDCERGIYSCAIITIDGSTWGWLGVAGTGRARPGAPGRARARPTPRISGHDWRNSWARIHPKRAITPWRKGPLRQRFWSLCSVAARTLAAARCGARSYDCAPPNATDRRRRRGRNARLGPMKPPGVILGPIEHILLWFYWPTDYASPPPPGGV
eukprot:gene14020-biopygen540